MAGADPHIHPASNSRPLLTGTLATNYDIARVGYKIERLTKWAVAICAMSLAAWVMIATLLIYLAVS